MIVKIKTRSEEYRELDDLLTIHSLTAERMFEGSPTLLEVKNATEDFYEAVKDCRDVLDCCIDDETTPSPLL